MQKQEKRKRYKEKGITLVALVITVIVLLILAGVSITMLIGENGIITQAQRAAQDTEQAQRDEEAELSNLETAIQEALGNVYNEQKGVNVPKLASGMTPIKFKEPSGTEKGSIIETTSEDEEWYEYGTEGSKKKWANATTEDGSMWVWIPRFAYKITYYTDSTKQTLSKEKTLYADIDIVFLKGTSNNYIDKNGNVGVAQKITSGVGEEYTNSQKNGNKYIVHPAFTDGTNNGFVNGEWDEEITGFWMAKFEMSMETDGSHTETSSYTIGNVLTNDKIKAVSKPGVSSWRYCQVGNWYTNGLNYNSNLNSHAIKNSEWGAVSYLTYSEYGRNGIKLTINNSSNYITGNAGNTIDAMPEEGIVNEYNTEAGVLASTTGNMYGIYDMSGGANDATMAYITSGSDFLETYGSSFASMDYSSKGDTHYRAISTKYATAYPQGESTTETVGIETGYNYWNTIYGDAIVEVSVENLENTELYQTIYGDIIEFETGKKSAEPFFIRGGIYQYGSNAGAFRASDFASSVYNNGGGFSCRFVLVI